MKRKFGNVLDNNIGNFNLENEGAKVAHSPIICPRSNENGQLNCNKHQNCFKDAFKCRENINNKGKCDERTNKPYDIRHDNVSLMDAYKTSDSVDDEKPSSVKIDGFVEDDVGGGFDESAFILNDCHSSTDDEQAGSNVGVETSVFETRDIVESDVDECLTLIATYQ